MLAVLFERVVVLVVLVIVVVALVVVVKDSNTCISNTPDL